MIINKWVLHCIDDYYINFILFKPIKDYSTKYLKTLTTYNALEDMATIIRDLKVQEIYIFIYKYNEKNV